MENKQGDSLRNRLKGSGISMNDIAIKLDMSRQNLNYHLKKDVLDKDFVKKVRTIFPGILQMENAIANALPTSNAIEIGEIQQKDGESAFIDLHNGRYLMVVPKIPVRAQAGYIEHYFDELYIEKNFEKEYFVVSQVYHGKYTSYVVEGDSMDNGSKESIPEGSTALGRDVKKEHWLNKLHLHRFQDYIVVHKDGIFIKRITKHDTEKGIITCHSLNPDKDRYADFDLHLDDCLQILNVVRVIQER